MEKAYIDFVCIEKDKYCLKIFNNGEVDVYRTNSFEDTIDIIRLFNKEHPDFEIYVDCNGLNVAIADYLRMYRVPHKYIKVNKKKINFINMNNNNNDTDKEFIVRYSI
jgi:hypothetical protein